MIARLSPYEADPSIVGFLSTVFLGHSLPDGRFRRKVFHWFGQLGSEPKFLFLFFPFLFSISTAHGDISFMYHLHLRRG